MTFVHDSNTAAAQKPPRDNVLSDHWPTAHLQEYESNLLLKVAPTHEYQRLAQHLETVKLTRGNVLYRPNEPISYVYFPQTGVISTVSHLDGERQVEVGTIGNEGMLGLPVFLAFDRVPVEATVHLQGVAKRVRAEVFRDLLSDCGDFHRVLHRYTLAFLTQVAQSAACDKTHSTTERCARWLLMTQDRMGSDHFQLTQELLALMLGIRRPGVSMAASSLQQAGLIQYRRGRVEIRNREGLEAASCECYSAVREQWAKMLTPEALSDASPG